MKRMKKVKTLAAERAKIKLPFKPEHVTEEQIREAVAELGGEPAPQEPKLWTSKSDTD